MKIFLLIVWALLFLFYLKKLIDHRKQLRQSLDIRENKLYSIIEQQLGESAVQSIKDQSLWKGMPECLIPFVMMIISPDEVKETLTPDGTFRIYYYKPIENTRTNARKKYNIEIHVRNKEVTYWEIMN
jgi:hypothetical protein